MIYRNAYTGAVIRSDCVIQGNGWEPVEDIRNDSPDATAAEEADTGEPENEESGKKTSTGRRKGK